MTHTSTSRMQRRIREYFDDVDLVLVAIGACVSATVCSWFVQRLRDLGIFREAISQTDQNQGA